AAGRVALDVAGATAQDPCRLARLRVLLGMAGTAVGHLEILSDAAELQGKCIERRIGPSSEDDGIFWRCRVQLLAAGVTLFAQPGDEELVHFDPLPRRKRL